MIRRIVSLLMVTAILLATMVGPAFADSTRVCNNRCGDIDQSTDVDNSTDNSVTDNSTTNVDNSVTDNSTTNVDNSVTDNSTTNVDNSVNSTTKTCGNLTQGSTCNIN